MIAAKETGFGSYFARVIGKPFWGRLRQGTIFSSVAVDDGRPRGFGVVITAHCDMANDKVSSVNYLPIVPFCQWCMTECNTVLCKNFKTEILGKIGRLLEDNEVSSELLKYESIEKIIQIHFERRLPDRKIQKVIDNLMTENAKLIKLKELSAKNSLTNAELATLIRLNNKSFEKYSTECIKNKLPDFYFLPVVSLENGDDGQGYVVLLRMIYSIPSELAKAVANGLTSAEYEKQAQVNPAWAGKLSMLDEEDFAMPVGQLESPHLEHLMQKFSILYTRIGLEDIPDQVVGKVYNSVIGEPK